VIRIDHISDLHFGAEVPALVESLVHALNQDPAALVVISGDLTMRARRAEFAAARRFLDRLRAPTLAVPGNHDITPYQLWERFTNPYARWRQSIAADIEPTWQGNSVAVLGINTARRAQPHWNWAHGGVSGRSLERLAGRLDALPQDYIRIVAAHHPFLPPANALRTPVARGAAAVLEVCARRGVALILGGHLHRHYSTSRLAGEPPIVLQCSTAVSRRLRGEPHSYNRIVIDSDGQMRIEVRRWDGTGWTTADGTC
jgi:3',5'-cyclic AMP phosphodiesterase CpdA